MTPVKILGGVREARREKDWGQELSEIGMSVLPKDHLFTGFEEASLRGMGTSGPQKHG